MQTCAIGRMKIGGDAQVHLMGVINCSPESFFRGSYVREEDLFSQACRMIEDGADIIDIGARSTAPDSPPLSTAEEARRMEAALSELSGSGIPVSVDTTQPEVLEVCLRHDIAALNDISGLADPALARIAGDAGLPAFLMASNREPGDAIGVDATIAALERVAVRARDSGITRIVLDPAIGKWTEERDFEVDWELCRHFGSFRDLGYPLLAAVSRKSFIGDLIGRPAPERLAGTLAVTWALLDQGAAIVRAHDVRETYDLIAVHGKLRRQI